MVSGNILASVQGGVGYMKLGRVFAIDIFERHFKVNTLQLHYGLHYDLSSIK